MRLMLPIMRRAAGLCLLLVMSACGEEPRSLPTAPTMPPVVAPPPPSTRTVTGSVWLYAPTGRQPLAAIDVGIWLERPRAVGPAGFVKSNSAGRFSFEAPSDALVRLYVGTKELFQPCLSSVRVGQTEATIRVVAESHLLQARDWPDFAVEQATLRDDIRGVADGAAAKCRCLGTGRRRDGRRATFGGYPRRRERPICGVRP